MKINTTIEYPLRKEMKKAGLTVRKLGELSGIHFTHISKLNTGKSNASEATARKLIEVIKKYK